MSAEERSAALARRLDDLKKLYARGGSAGARRAFCLVCVCAPVMMP